MKSSLITLLLFIGLTGVASAQKQDRHGELPGNNDPSIVRVREVTRQLCNSLHLNEAQYIRLRAVNQIRLTRLDEITWQYKDDIVEQRARISELESQYEAECRRILTPSQISALRTEEQHDDIRSTIDANEGGVG
ncbi:hypothetical protein [Hymenobacter sp. YC55]|uniref:hypothetical protein n=1 Tax=Hymenobacter sp. YC55 TaxID=3034019 RepID=UPI0023F63719|nr:hypothetical protein [Hymenobacter sp. YC55]MDF7811419.1 hypothetical protein [Hymenobacter sp. YC55]